MPPSCSITTPPWLPRMPERLSVSSELLTAANASVASATGELLRGKCMVLLGDSTMTETAHDLAVLLFGLTGSSFDNYLRRATRMPSHATTRLENNVSLLHVGGNVHGAEASVGNGQGHLASRDEGGDGAFVTFAPTHRRMWFTAPRWNVTVVHRFIGHASLMGNGMGIRSLNAPELRQELEALVAERCGARPRVLWLQSGYHDVENVKLLPLFRFFFARAVDWAETLAPRRLWLSRQAAEHENVTAVEDWVRTSGIPPRASWTYVDHRRAWTCAVLDTERVSMHTGTIMQGFHSPDYCCYHLSCLRTWLAVRESADAKFATFLGVRGALPARDDPDLYSTARKW